MKNASLFQNMTLLYLLVFLSSCSILQKTGFEKRRYQKGFYHSSLSFVHTKSKTPQEINSIDKKVTFSIIDVQRQKKQTYTLTSKKNDQRVQLCLSNNLTPKFKKRNQSLSFSKSSSITSNAKNSLKKFKPKPVSGKKTMKTIKKRSSGLMDALVETLVILLFTIIYYLIAICLMALFPSMSLPVALGLAVVIIIVGIVILALALSKRKKSSLSSA